MNIFIQVEFEIVSLTKHLSES